MLITNLKLNNFRNYAEEKISFSSGLNVLSGLNASGKTNMLEAVYLLGIGKSPRTAQDRELIQWNKEYLYISAEVKKKYQTLRIEIHIDSRLNKRIAINGMPVSRVGELMGALNVIYFSPDELKLIKDSPRERRRFMDISLSQQKKVYFYTLQRYNRILDQRNKLLKNTFNRDALESMLIVWDIQLSEAGADIICARNDFINKLNIHAMERHKLLTDGKETLSLEYESGVSGGVRQEIIEQLKEQLLSDREKDYNLKYTSAGPHRDDIRILVNDSDVRKFGSQGQQRSAALSLKMAEISHFEMETGEKPVLLLDDVLSELDLMRQRQLIHSAENIQTILTCTEYDLNTNIKPKIFRIDQGRIIR